MAAPFVHAVINIQDPVRKVVGRRRAPNPLSLQGQTKADMRAWKKAFPLPFIPRGVYRFKTHEEADQWLMNQMVSSAAKAKG